ncbi:hypothetical protein CEXT_509891 [Caerostris extrusa]|uniref:Uncharacterized protein n=1 Tax=Caerostris extrusa TaxID=172846 RepID=A0AAV4NDR8_CAEEX|nr:hypothetical protein CEXT_509891 [Caerostris extrusa]
MSPVETELTSTSTYTSRNELTSTRLYTTSRNELTSTRLYTTSRNELTSTRLYTTSRNELTSTSLYTTSRNLTCIYQPAYQPPVQTNFISAIASMHYN